MINIVISFIDYFDKIKILKFFKKNLHDKQINVIDIGAHKGETLKFFLDNFNVNKIFAFEPNKKLFIYLQNKYRTQTKHKQRVKLHNFGVSNINGKLVFHENILDETSTFEELNFDSKYLEKKSKILGVAKENIIVDNYKVNVIRLTDFLKDNPNKEFDVLKIDVEGHELQCLQGLFNNELKIIPIRYIQLESHNDDMYLNNNQQHDIESLLNKNGFEKASEIKHGFGGFTEIIYENKITK